MIIVTAEIYCDARQYGMSDCRNMFRTGSLPNNLLTSIRKAAREEGWWRVPESPNYYPRHLCPACRALQKARGK